MDVFLEFCHEAAMEKSREELTIGINTLKILRVNVLTHPTYRNIVASIMMN